MIIARYSKTVGTGDGKSSLAVADVGDGSIACAAVRAGRIPSSLRGSSEDQTNALSFDRAFVYHVGGSRSDETPTGGDHDEGQFVE